ncbi:CHRD domain-containing protein [Tautonia sp. JC769]|uniref:CHRD domain-containing protein n=1 Tax=Tautonia sp. JC769 TaxID=3232135 RepID=UPI0034599A6A
MVRGNAAISALFIVLATASAGQAETLFYAILSHDQETSQGDFLTDTDDPRPESFGNASLVLNADMTALSFSVTVFNIDFTGSQTADTNDDLVAAHIHSPAGPGVNAPVVFGFFGSPFNDDNPNDVVVTPFASGVGGVISSKWDLTEGRNTTLAAQIPNLLAGQTYLNFHTRQFPAGEIRGQILMIPEPSTLALCGIGAVATIGLVRRSRRKIMSRVS